MIFFIKHNLNLMEETKQLVDIITEGIQEKKVLA